MDFSLFVDAISASGIVSRVTPVHAVVRNCTRDEGTERGASTLTPVIAGSIEIAMTNSTLGAIAAYTKG
jgi:hypothetical protein